MKLYFKKEPLNKKSIDMLLFILYQTYKDQHPDYLYAVFDLRKNKKYVLNINSIDDDIGLALDSELHQYQEYLQKLLI